MKGIFLTLAVFILFGFTHDFHVSLCQIEHNEESKTLEVSMRFFIDDLEKALTKDDSLKVVLDRKQDQKKINALISDYIQSNFSVIVNGKLKSFLVIGKELEQDIVWCYVEVAEVTEIKSLWIKNTVLMELFENQSNIIQVNIGEKKESLLFSKTNYEGTLHF